MKLRVLSLGLALAAVAATASAQLRAGTVEINGFGGYMFGGSADAFSSLFPSASPINRHVDVEDHVMYGGRLGFNLTNLWEMEFEYTRFDTSFVTRNQEFAPRTRIGDLTFDYYMGYVTFNLGHRRFVPFFTIGSGAANVNPRVPGALTSSEVRYTAGIGGGFKIFVNPHFAFRFDGRAYSTYLTDTDFSCHDGFCHGHSHWITNGGPTGGLLIAF